MKYAIQLFENNFMGWSLGISTCNQFILSDRLKNPSDREGIWIQHLVEDLVCQCWAWNLPQGMFWGSKPKFWPICWLIGAWPRFRVKLTKQIPVLLSLSAIVRRAWTGFSPKVVWDGARTRFPHLGDVWWGQVVHGSTLRTCRYTHFPIPRSLRDCLRITLLGGRTLLLPKSLLVFQC